MGPFHIILAIIILLGIGITFLISYLKFLKTHIFTLWLQVLDQLRRRADLVPLLLEVLKRNSIQISSDFMERIIQTRRESWVSFDCDNQKVSKELELSTQIQELFQLAEQNGPLKNSLYLALKKEFSETTTKIAQAQENYNNKSKKFNKFYGLFFLIPFYKIFQLNRFILFQGEGFKA